MQEVITQCGTDPWIQERDFPISTEETEMNHKKKFFRNET